VLAKPLRLLRRLPAAGVRGVEGQLAGAHLERFATGRCGVADLRLRERPGVPLLQGLPDRGCGELRRGLRPRPGVRRLGGAGEDDQR